MIPRAQRHSSRRLRYLPVSFFVPVQVALCPQSQQHLDIKDLLLFLRDQESGTNVLPPYHSLSTFRNSVIMVIKCYYFTMTGKNDPQAVDSWIREQ